MSLVNANAITFAADARMKMAAYGTARASLALMGLLAQGVSFNSTQTNRQKKDGFPEVVVAEAVQAQEGTLEARLREWRTGTIAPALGLFGADVTTTVGGDTAVVAELVTLNSSDVTALRFPRKLAPAAVVTNVGAGVTYILNTDYRIVERDLEGRTLIVRVVGGAITAGQTLQVSYTYTATALETYGIGSSTQAKRYFGVEFEQTLTNGGSIKLYIPKASISIPSNFDFNTPENTAELPVRIVAIKDPAQVFLAILENIPGAGA